MRGLLNPDQNGKSQKFTEYTGTDTGTFTYCPAMDNSKHPGFIVLKLFCEFIVQHFFSHVLINEP